MVCPSYIEKILDRLAACGESAYIVGGSLRDMLLGLPPHDYDIATSALPERTAEIFSDMRVIETGLKHGTVTVIADGEPVEITTFRIDGEYTDSRHPDSVSFTDDITKDLSRRDFTVNAMAYNPAHGLIDPFGGREDIEAKRLRAVREPTLRFGEDALRIMRAYRFSAQLGFDIEPQTLEATAKCAEGLSHIARERIGSEFIRLITSPYPQRALELMKSHGIFKYVFKDYTPSRQLISLIEALPSKDTLRLALLLSDTDEEWARVHLRELRCSGKQITGVLATLRGAQMKIETDTDARRLLAVTGIYAADAARLSEALRISPQGAAELTERQMNTPCSLRDLKINGKDLALMGIKGKAIGQTLSSLLARVIDDPALNDRDTLLRMAKEIIKI